MGDSTELNIINSFLLNFQKYNINDLYNNLLNKKYILNLTNYSGDIDNYIHKLLDKDTIITNINDNLEDKINYYLDDFKLNNINNNSGSIDIDISYYASKYVKYYSMILDFLSEYYRNLANIIKENEYLDNNSLYKHEFEIKIRYYFNDSKKIIQLNQYKIFKFKLNTNQDKSGYKDIVMPNQIINYKLFEIINQEMVEIIGGGDLYNDFVTNYIINKKYLNFDINKLDYYFLLSKSYLYKFYKLLLNYHISKAIYFFYQKDYKNKVPEINDIITNKFPYIFENFRLILSNEDNDNGEFSILTIVTNTKKKQKILEEKKKKEIKELEDKINILNSQNPKNQDEINKLNTELNNLYNNSYITTDRAKVNEAMKYKKDLHNINKNLMDNEEKIKKLDDTIKRDKSYLNQVNIIMYICIFVLIIIFFTFSITNLTNVNISVAITLLIISMILYFSSNYYINNSNHEHKKPNLFSNLFNNFIIIESYDDSSSAVESSSDGELITEDVISLLRKLKNQESDEQIQNIFQSIIEDRSIINSDGYVKGEQINLSRVIDDIITTQYDNTNLFENNISLKKKGEENREFYNLIANRGDGNELDDNLSKFFGTSVPDTVYQKLYNEIYTNGNIDNVIILPFDNNSSGSYFTEYELNIPSYFKNSSTFVESQVDTDVIQQVETPTVDIDIIVVGGGSAGQSFTKQSDVTEGYTGSLEQGSGGSGGAVIRYNYNFTHGKYIIGVGKGGVYTGQGDENIKKSGKGSYLKKEDTVSATGNKSNNFIIFACGGIYNDDTLIQRKISISGGILELSDGIDIDHTLKYEQINKNIININDINTNTARNFILNSSENFSRGGTGGALNIQDVSSRQQLFISNQLTPSYATFITDKFDSYGESEKNGKIGVSIEINLDIIKDNPDIKERVVDNSIFYISGGGGAIGACLNSLYQLASIDNTRLFIACDGDGDHTNISGTGGTGGGGNGNYGGVGNNGYNGTGSGGGGGGYREDERGVGTSYPGGNGGSGVVILKYNKGILSGKFEQFKEKKKNELKTLLLDTIAEGNILKLQSAFTNLTGGIQELNTQKNLLKYNIDFANSKKEELLLKIQETDKEKKIRNMQLYGYFIKTSTDDNIYEIKNSNDDTLYKTILVYGTIILYMKNTNDNNFTNIGDSIGDSIGDNLKNIFDKNDSDNYLITDDRNYLIIDQNDVDYLFSNKNNITYLDQIYVPGIIYLRKEHEEYINNLGRFYQEYGSLLSDSDTYKSQSILLDGELELLESQITNLKSREGDEIQKKLQEEDRNSIIITDINNGLVKQAKGRLCLSIINDLIIGLELELQKKEATFTADKMALLNNLTNEKKKAIKDKNDAKAAKRIALEQQQETEKQLEEKRAALIEALEDQNLPENKKSFLIDFEFNLDYRIAGNLLDDTLLFDPDTIRKQNEKRRKFEDKIKTELFDALKTTYPGIDITTSRFEINRISSGNLYGINRTRENSGILSADEYLTRKYIADASELVSPSPLSSAPTVEPFTVEEHFVGDTLQNLEQNRMIVQIEILPNSRAFLDETNTARDILFKNPARDILYKILNVSSCKINPNDDNDEPDEIDMNICVKNDDQTELLNNLDSVLRIKRYFRYLTRYRVGVGIKNFLEHYNRYINGEDIVKKEVESTWINVVKTDLVITNHDKLLKTSENITAINGIFSNIDKLRFQQETYYDKMNPLLKKEYKKYDEIENNNNIYKKMKQQSDNINTYDIRLKEILINYFITLSILVSLYLIIIHYVNHIVVLLILILIIVIISIFLLMNIYQIVKTRSNKNYWPKENKYIEIKI